jgi:hypothetical protein
MNLLINISQIAIITGDNPYKSKREYLIEFWEKNFNKDYLEYQKKTKFMKNTDEEIIKTISKKNNIDIKNDIQKCIETDNTNDLNNIKKTIFEKMDKLSNDEKKEITKSLNNVTNTNFGIKNENDVTKIYKNMKGVSIIKDDKYRKKKIIQNNNFNIYIGGKIDGINFENNCIVEVKNRINKLFYSLRDYEKVQIMSYMYLFSSSKGHLVEAFLKKENTNINIIEVDYDENYMKEIISKIFNFGNYFFHFMNNENLKIHILKNKNEIEF